MPQIPRRDVNLFLPVINFTQQRKVFCTIHFLSPPPKKKLEPEFVQVLIHENYSKDTFSTRNVFISKYPSWVIDWLYICLRQVRLEFPGQTLVLSTYNNLKDVQVVRFKLYIYLSLQAQNTSLYSKALMLIIKHIHQKLLSVGLYYHDQSAIQSR